MAKIIYTIVTVFMLSPWIAIRLLGFLVFVLNIIPAIPLHLCFSRSWAITKKAFRREIGDRFRAMVADLENI